MQIAPHEQRGDEPHLFLSAQYNLVNNPLVEYDPTHSYQTAVLVGSINTLDLTVGAMIQKNIEVSVNLPLNYSHPIFENNTFGLGDTRLQGKFQLYQAPRSTNGSTYAFALIPEIYLPSGNRSLFLSNGAFGYAIKGVFEGDFGKLRVAGNIGYRHTDGAQFLDINYTHLMPWAVGLLYPFGPRWGVNLEASGALAFPTGSFNNPADVYLGGRYQIQKDMDLHFGVSSGGFSSDDSGNIRGIIGVRYMPNLSGNSSAQQEQPLTNDPAVEKFLQ
jgi:hypothetical protein